jgi:signal transduction histidine kinase
MASLEKLARSAQQMAALVQELQDAAQVQAGRSLELRTGSMDLAALAGQVVEDQQATTQDHRIRLHQPATAVEGLWDAARLRRVIGNLVSNAIKYSPDGGEVVVTLGREVDEGGGAWAVLRVADQGMGIPAAELPRLFRPYFRASNASGRVRGVGLGLAGVKRVVEQHGGTVAVQSTQGRGSTFTVRLPLPQSPVFSTGPVPSMAAGGTQPAGDGGRVAPRRRGGTPRAPHPGGRRRHRDPRGLAGGAGAAGLPRGGGR